MLATLVDRFHTRRVAVIGDLIADEFVYGRVTRVSREAPVLILGYDSTTMTPGGAGNAAANIAALSGHAQLVGVVGDDDVGNRLVEIFPTGVDLRRLVRVPGIRTSLKTRILAGGAHSARQQSETTIASTFWAASTAVFDRPQDVGLVQLGMQDVSLADYPRRLVVESVDAQGTVHRLYRGGVMVQLLEGLVRDWRWITLDIPLAPNQTRVLRIRQTAQTRNWYWSIHELSLWTSPRM